MSLRLNLRIVIAAVGRQRSGPEKDLFDAYKNRLPWPIRLIEVKEFSSATAAGRRRRETERLFSAAPKGSKLIALDAKGRAITSKELSRCIAQWRNDGVRDLVFIIGGPDGLDKGIAESADALLSLGSMTWPHLLVRVLLAEQLYRAHTILTGHPYHRE